MAESVVAGVLVLVGMLLALWLVRIAANTVILLASAIALVFVVHHVQSGLWTGWTVIGGRSLLTGAVVALLCLPVLPFSTFFRKK